MQYVSLMVMAYCNATGKSEEEALKDLAIDGFVRTQDLEKITSNELLDIIPKDTSGILAWARTSSGSESQ